MEEILQDGEVGKMKENVGRNTGMDRQSLKVLDKQLSGEQRLGWGESRDEPQSGVEWEPGVKGASLVAAAGCF